MVVKACIADTDGLLIDRTGNNKSKTNAREETKAKHSQAAVVVADLAAVAAAAAPACRHMSEYEDSS
jgi:hypothetical protein